MLAKGTPDTQHSNRSTSYSAANAGIRSRSPISKATPRALCSPCSRTKSSSRSARRPTTVTFAPPWTRRAAMARPMPAVAPTTRTCLYGKDIVWRVRFARRWDEGNLSSSSTIAEWWHRRSQFNINSTPGRRAAPGKQGIGPNASQSTRGNGQISAHLARHPVSVNTNLLI